MVEKELPLTHLKNSSVTQETRARFESLLQAALNTESNGQESVDSPKLNQNLESHTTFSPKYNGHRRKSLETSRGSKQHRELQIKEVKEKQNSSHHSPVQTFSVSSSDCDRVSNVNSPKRVKVKTKKRLVKASLNEHSNIIRSDIINNENNQNRNDEQVIIVSRNLESRSYSLKIKQSDGDTLDIISDEQSSIIVEDNYMKNDGEESTLALERPVPLPRIKTGKKKLSTEYKNEPEVKIRSPTSDKDNLDKSLLKQSKHQETGSAVKNVHEKSGVPRKPKRRIKKSNPEETVDLLKESKEQEQILKLEEQSTSQTTPHKSKTTKDSNAEADVSTSAEVKYQQIVGIFIHRSDCLEADFLVQHPVVKVHLIDAGTGEYLKKSSSGRSVSFYYENKEVDYILPLMTEVFDFRARRSIVPCWEELIVFNEDVDYIMKDDPSVIIMFEIMDFVNTSIASSQYKRLGPEGGWHKVAWAFLKPVGANGALNTGKKVRLQLYKPHRMKRNDCDTCDVYHWWSRGTWERYPATLYVTVKGIIPPLDMPPVLRSRVALQQEFTSSVFDCEEGESRKETENNQEIMEDEDTLNSQTKLTVLPQPTWSRLPAQSCKIPNHCQLVLPTATKGCFTLKFSNCGLFLACAMAGEDFHTIVIYTIPGGKKHTEFVGHQGLVYDLHWSSNDSLLLSASADCTACVWDVENKKLSSLQMLPHPSFVYCAHFHSNKSSLLATGCCDHMIRIWNRGHKVAQYELMQELEGHMGFISSLCFDQFGTLISADSIGRILMWSSGASGKSRKHFSSWQLQRDLSLRELRDTVINKIQLHPGGQRMLVHARDSLLRMVDLATASTIQWFKGALNYRVQTSACLSPCGGLVFAASEDGTVCVWNTDTGEQLALYSGLQFPKGVHAVDYHPYDHLAAFSSHGSTSRIIVSGYSKRFSDRDLGLELLNHPDASNIDFSLLEEKDSDLKSQTSKYTNNMSRSEMSLKSFQKELDEIGNKSQKKKKVTSEDSHATDQDSLSNASWNNNSLLTSTQIVSLQNNSEIEPNRLRLVSIIEKMDAVLSTSPARSTVDISGSPAAQTVNYDKNKIVSTKGRVSVSSQR